MSGALLSHFNDLEQARKAAEEDYCGCYASLAGSCCSHCSKARLSVLPSLAA
ncbi:hypothetical protein D3C78_1602120 [compost metagenome]